MHLSLIEGLDYHWPFGQSILEMIYKAYKQKELIEDAILISRIQRAPERRVFKIHTGSMPSHLAMGFVERVKNEIHQRRIPTSDGMGNNSLDASYSPLSQNEDYFFPVDENGNGSSVEILNGGTQLNTIDDLRLWNNKIARGMRVPSSYLPSSSGNDDSADSTGFNDGGTAALMQEYRFNQYCLRLQRTIISELNKEFKMFLKFRGFNIDAKLFDIKFNDPQNFASNRQIEQDSARLSNFSAVSDLPFISKRFAIKRYLGLTEEEMTENERMWREENVKVEDIPTEQKGDALRSVGVSPGDIDADMENFGELEGEADELDGGDMDDLADTDDSGE